MKTKREGTSAKNPSNAGWSQTAKSRGKWLLLSAGLMIWGGIVVVATISNNKTSAREKVSSPKSTLLSPSAETETLAEQSQLPYVRELPVLVAADDHSSAHILSAEAMQLRRLWIDLEGFKHDPKFHALGFENPFEYGEWRAAVRKLDDAAGRSLISEVQLSPGELLTLGDEYLHSKGLRSKRSDNIVERLDAALNTKKRQSGEWRIARNSQGCVEFDKLARSLRELETGNFGVSNALLEEANCVPIPNGAIVSAPAARKAYSWLKTKDERVYVSVKYHDKRVWVPEDELSF